MNATSLLPLNVEDLTAEWFARVLGRDVAEATVVDQSYGTTGRARVALRGAPGVPGVPASVFVKLAPRDEQQRLLVTQTGMGMAEARFYRELAREVNVRVPEVWYADTDGAGYVMVLENLALSGCRFPGAGDADIEARCRNIVEQLASLHAPFWNSERFAPGHDLNWLVGRGVGGGYKYMKLAADTLRDHMDGEFQRIMSSYLKHSREIVQLWFGGIGTLIHGDCHIGNLFVDVKDGGRTGFLDWAMVNRSPGIRDVAYVTCQTLEPEARRRLERGLIDRYCECLAMGGVELDPAAAWDQYRLFAIYSWMSSTTTAGMGSKWQNFDIGLAATKRTTAACLELDSFGLVEKLLA